MGTDVGTKEGPPPALGGVLGTVGGPGRGRWRLFPRSVLGPEHSVHMSVTTLLTKSSVPGGQPGGGGEGSAHRRPARVHPTAERGGGWGTCVHTAGLRLL